MLTVDIAALKPTQLSTLTPGAVFLHGRYSGQGLAVALERDGTHVLWLNLSGERKFVLEANERGGMAVFPLLANPDSLQLRIAPDSVYDPNADYVPGHLLVGDDGPSIACRWDNDPNWDYRNVATLTTWTHTRAENPRFRFSKWTLGYEDAAGKWNEVISVGE